MNEPDANRPSLTDERFEALLTRLKRAGDGEPTQPPAGVAGDEVAGAFDVLADVDCAKLPGPAVDGLEQEAVNRSQFYVIAGRLRRVDFETQRADGDEVRLACVEFGLGGSADDPPARRVPGTVQWPSLSRCCGRSARRFLDFPALRHTLRGQVYLENGPPKGVSRFPGHCARSRVAEQE